MLVEGILLRTNFVIICMDYKVLYSFCYLQEEVEEVLKLQYWMDYVSIFLCTSLFADTCRLVV